MLTLNLNLVLNVYLDSICHLWVRNVEMIEIVSWEGTITQSHIEKPPFISKNQPTGSNKTLLSSIYPVSSLSLSLPPSFFLFEFRAFLVNSNPCKVFNQHQPRNRPLRTRSCCFPLFNRRFLYRWMIDCEYKNTRVGGTDEDTAEQSKPT